MERHVGNRRLRYASKHALLLTFAIARPLKTRRTSVGSLNDAFVQVLACGTMVGNA
jgi:hypothetical protein